MFLSAHVTDGCQGSVGWYFHAELIEITSVGLDITADQLVEFIHIWAQSGAIIEADRVSLDVDPECATQLESFTVQVMPVFHKHHLLTMVVNNHQLFCLLQYHWQLLQF